MGNFLLRKFQYGIENEQKEEKENTETDPNIESQTKINYIDEEEIKKVHQKLDFLISKNTEEIKSNTDKNKIVFTVFDKTIYESKDIKPPKLNLFLDIDKEGVNILKIHSNVQTEVIKTKKHNYQIILGRVDKNKNNFLTSKLDLYKQVKHFINFYQLKYSIVTESNQIFLRKTEGDFERILIKSIYDCHNLIWKTNQENSYKEKRIKYNELKKRVEKEENQIKKQEDCKDKIDDKEEKFENNSKIEKSSSLDELE